MSIYSYTPNFGFPLSNFDTPNWHEEDWARWGLADSLLMGNSAVPFAVATGAVNAFAVTYSPAITAYTFGLVLAFKPNLSNTGASTLNVNGLGVKALKFNGSDTVANDLPLGSYVRVLYDGTNFIVLDPKKPVNVTTNIFKAASGGTPNASTDFYIEDSNNIYQELLSPNITTQGFMFSRPSLSFAGGIKYDHVNDLLTFTVNGAIVGTINAIGNFTIARLIGNVTGNVTGTATSLATTRTFTFNTDVTGSLTFDGTANVSATLTIANDAVTNAKLNNVATNTLKGRVTAGTGDPEDLNSTQATTIINAMVPDSGSGGIKGLAPAPQAGSAAADLFLGAGGIWKQSMPSGAVMAFAGSTAPVGWLKCNGAAVSRTTYATLFAYIGVVYGAGDGSTTFNLPELRGEFVRGWDDARGVDGGRTIGTFQIDDLISHNHSIPSRSNTNSGTFVEDADSTGTVGACSTGNTGGTETRPRNVSLLYCIKF